MNRLLSLRTNPDVVIAIGLGVLAAMLIVPVPAWVLDALIPINLALALAVLASAVFAKKAIDLSTFPTLLLVATLSRLALNVSATRGILLDGHAGAVVEAFGKLVVGGDLVVGVVMFLVITIVQLLVIGKGAERVAEVGARFTLDAMPGKQMAIDAAVRAGAIDEDEAQRRRDELGRASMLLGSLDGAMKFVKGDAIAGLAIVGINIVAGVAIGVLRRGLEITDALGIYATLTIGDALVAQVGALLVTLAAAVLVTRVEPKDKTHGLGQSLTAELLDRPKVLALTAGGVIAIGFAPGLPLLPFAIAAVMVGAIGGMRHLRKHVEAGARPAPFAQQLAKQVEAAKKHKAMTDQLAPTVVPITIDLGRATSESLGYGASEDSALARELIPQLRDALYLETGVKFPGVRIRPFARGVAETSMVVRIDDVPVLERTMTAGTCLATASPDQLARLGVRSIAATHPVSGAPAARIDEADKTVVEASGVVVWDLAGTIALSLAAILRRRAARFITVQDVADLVERLERAYPALVKEVVPKIATVPQLVGILRRLVEEGVSIRNFRAIVEALGEFGTRDGDPVYLTEKVRSALGSQLAYSYAGMGHALPAILLDPVIEDAVQSAITSGVDGMILAIEPALAQELIASMVKATKPMTSAGKRPVILTRAEIRRFVRKLIETELPTVAVLSFEELPMDLAVQPMGRAMAA